MVQELNPGIFLTPLRQIPGEKGDVLHALKNSETTFSNFGEVYFSTVLQGVFKGWKRHTKMVLNLVVPVGDIRFYIVDDRSPFQHKPFTYLVDLSRKNYYRLTIPPGVWLGFEGLDAGVNMLLNIASIPHDPTEAESADMSRFAANFPELLKAT